MKKTYDVVFYVRGAFHVTVNADSVEEAVRRGVLTFEEKDFSPLEVVDGKLDRVEEDNGETTFFN